MKRLIAAWSPSSPSGSADYRAWSPRFLRLPWRPTSTTVTTTLPPPAPLLRSTARRRSTTAPPVRAASAHGRTAHLRARMLWWSTTTTTPLCFLCFRSPPAALRSRGPRGHRRESPSPFDRDGCRRRRRDRDPTPAFHGSKQFGGKWGRHAADYGLDPGDSASRSWFMSRARDVHLNPDE